MADEKLNTGPAENTSPEAAGPITTPEQAAASEPRQEHTGPTIPEPGDVVVSFDKINELMAEKRQNARAEVEKAETPEAPEAALSHNVIMADRKKLKSANGMYLGSTGSGKSFAAKRELLNVFLTIPQDRIIVVDPMGEYAPLVRRLGGQVIEIAPDSPHHLNPMDVELNMAAGESPLSMKADFLLSLCELVVGGKEGLQPIEKTVIDRCVRLVYREQALGLETAKTPLLQDLYEELLRQPEPEARRVATALELYCTGSLNLFNHPTNVKTDSRVVCIVLKNMGENLRKIAMHITNEFVSQAVDQNFHEGAATWCYFDEFHILLRDPLTASYFVAVWKMLRKKGCVPSALTQNVKDLLASREIENILDNTDFMILLSQAQSDRTILAKQLGISEHQLSYITHSNSGEGLLFYGNVTIPFVDRFPRGEIYDLLTTRPEDMKNDYDEYHFDLDEIEHDPYVLLSLLCALHEGQWTIGEVQGTLQMLFDRQYILTEDVVVETRYRTETDTWTDEDGNSHTDTYQVPYDYYICTVTLENFDLSHVPVYVMGEDQLSRYAIYMATLGNRPDLFPDSPYVNKYITGKPGDYEVPGEYLDDEAFAAMLAEAQKYIGYQNIEALNREILVELVDYIKVYENGNISVKFKFADELRKIAEYIEINTTEDTTVAG